MAAVVEVRLVELRQLHPGWGAGRLLYRLEREGCGPLPSRAAVSCWPGHAGDSAGNPAAVTASSSRLS
jgi:hypothetical protein